MAANQSRWPRRWLMTDERIGDRLWDAIDRLPTADGGIVFRHYGLSEDDRRRLGAEVAAAARRRNLVLAVAGSSKLAEELGAQLVHNPDSSTGLPISLAVHNEAEAGKARLLAAALVFVAPIHGTRSHPGRSSLGADRAAKLARLAGCRAIALGGMDPARFEALEGVHPGLFHGFAGIDCWLNDQIRT